MNSVTFHVQTRLRTPRTEIRLNRKTGKRYPHKGKIAEDFQFMVSTYAHLAMRGKPPIEGAMRVRVELFFEMPASFSKKKQRAALAGEIKCVKRKDLDNVMKLVSDAMNGIVYKDDSQVIELLITKQYGEEEGVTVHAEEV